MELHRIGAPGGGEGFPPAFSLNSKDEILESIDTSYSGSIDIQTLMQELQRTVETVDENQGLSSYPKGHLPGDPQGNFQRKAISALPSGRERIPSTEIPGFIRGGYFGKPRNPHPGYSRRDREPFQLDQHSGYLVVLEPDTVFFDDLRPQQEKRGESGQTVQRGGIIAYVGSTGKVHGSHVHYEIWEKGERQPEKIPSGEVVMFTQGPGKDGNLHRGELELQRGNEGERNPEG